MRSLSSLRAGARALKRDMLAVWLAARDPRTPLHVKALAVLVAAYAFSPIDLIPDFIPVLGYLDDILLVPLGVRAVVALMPKALRTEFRAEAERRTEQPTSMAGAIGIGLVWLTAAAGVGWFFWQ